MMNGTAVLPASVATAFAGNAAAISAGNPKNSSESGSTGDFSDTLGAMTTSGQQINMNSATRISAENTAIMSGDALSELAELEQSAEELKELLKTAELASYMQGNTAQFFADIIQTDNSELTQILTGNDSTDVVLQPVVAELVQNDVDPNVIGLISENIAHDPQNDVILPESSGENGFADEIQISAGEITDNVIPTSDTAEITSNTGNDENIAVAMTDNSDVPAIDLSDTDKTPSLTDTVRTDGQETVNIQSGKAETAKADTPEFTVTSYEKSADNTDNNVKQDIQTQDDSTPEIAFTKRNIESKSDELRAITKGNEVTKSDSDLDADQKVTEKNAVNDMSAKGADVFARTESRTDESGQESQAVRVPISDMASFVSEHAPKANGKSTMTVVLTPETLGKITVRMVNESGKLTVEILTETQAAKELLQARSEQLAYALRNDDVELTSYKVETSQAELFQRDFDGSSKNPYRQQSHDRQKNDTDDFDSLLGEIQAMG
ncbi:MAG: flagellar hook-length control protein FliK [Ruminiclostridium sp.]|nr:flagellar hook-length control protein FliK [Ruminiclostridium sp.]